MLMHPRFCETIFAGSDRLDRKALVLEHASKRVANALFVIDYENCVRHPLKVYRKLNNKPCPSRLVFDRVNSAAVFRDYTLNDRKAKPRPAAFCRKVRLK
jgi:hypothetical protein